MRSLTVESVLKRDVTRCLNATGLLWLRLNSGKVRIKGGYMQLCPEGTPDIICFAADGTPCWLEIKPAGQTTAKSRQEAQGAFGERVMALGHRWARCESTEDVIALVKA